MMHKLRKIQERLMRMKTRNLFAMIALLGYGTVFSYTLIMNPKILYQQSSLTVQWLSQLQIPSWMRYSIYSYYCRRYGVNMEEIPKPLRQYPTFQQFFTREIIPRPIDKSPNSLVSPVDGRILSIQEIREDQTQIVKGKEYSLAQLLYDQDTPLTSTELQKMKAKPQNKLYSVIFYLSPANYHRFHAPTDLHALSICPIDGEHKPVNEKALMKLGGRVYDRNVRKVMNCIHEIGGVKAFLGLVFVGAFNVAHIHLQQQVRNFLRGDQIGCFRLGSTVVMIFQSPEIGCWGVKEGDAVNYGQCLFTI